MSKQSLFYKYKTADIAVKLIVINVAAYILFNFIPWIMGMSFSPLKKYFVLPNALFDFIQQPWSVISYSFLHSGFRHLLWNMVALHFISRYILNIFTERRLLTIYLLGAISGGVLFLGLTNLIPVLSGNSYLVGASAAVAAILIFIASYTPQVEIRIFTISIKLWYIAVAFVAVNVLGLPTSSNAGGLVAHLGGAAFGYMYARQLLQGNDIGEWFEKLMDIIIGWFSKTPKQKKSPLRTVHKTSKKKQASSATSRTSKSVQQQKIDSILDKISKSGYESLSKSEKDFLFRAGKEDS